MAYFEQTRLTDSNGNVINPAEQQPLYYTEPQEVGAPAVRTATGSIDDQIILLRRIVKLMESQAATDGSQRQRVVLDAAIPSGANTIGGVNIASGQTLATVTTVTTVTTVSTVTAVNNLAALAGYDQRLYADWARTAYNTGIRANLIFT